MKLYYRIGTITLALCLCFLLLAPLMKTTANANLNQFEAMRNKWKQSLTGGTGYEVSDPDISKQLDYIASTAKDNWDNMNKNNNRQELWKNMSSLPDSAQITKTYERLETMALAYSSYGCRLYNNVQLKSDLISALDWMYTNRFNENVASSGNWWDWRIGAPSKLTNIIILLYGDLSSTQINNYISAIQKYSPDIDNKATAANILSECKIIALTAVISKDTLKLDKVRDSVTKVLPYVQKGDGFYADGSFIQHERFPYTGSYGIQMLADIAAISFILQNSASAISGAQLSNVYKWVHESFEPLIYRGGMMDMSRGRAISRPEGDHAAGHDAIRAILLLSTVASTEESAKLKSIVKYYIQSDTIRNFYNGPIYYTQLSKKLADDPTVQPQDQLIKHKQFPAMDRIVHLRPGFAFGIAMSSSRIYNYETINEENLKGWYTGDGMTYLYNSDLAQFNDGFWATIDPYRLPGTTVDVFKRADKSASKYLSTKNWVGGTDIAGMYGIAGMELDAVQSSLEAKKSWFMFDDEIVALGTGITSTDNRSIETVIENRKLNAQGNNTLTVNGRTQPASLGWSADLTDVSWVHLAGNVSGADIGYYFPNNMNIKALRESRTGSWQNINRLFGKPDSLTRNFLSMSIDHGTNPSNSNYAYVLLPNKSSRETELYSKEPDISILANTEQQQAVQERVLGITGVNFWQQGSVGFISSTGSASVMTRQNDGQLMVSVSDPTQQQDTVSIELQKKAGKVISCDPSINVVQMEPTVKLQIDMSNSKGQSKQAKFLLK